MLLLGAAGAWFWWHWRKPAIPAPQAAPGKLASSRQPSPSVVSNLTSQPVVVVVPSNPPPEVISGATPGVGVNAPSAQVSVRTPAAVAPRGDGFPRPPRDVLEAQIALARQGISSGSLDGVLGSQTRAALRVFQRREGLPETGLLDADTRAALRIESPPLVSCAITAGDLARLQPLSPTWLGKSQQSALDYETILELVAEQSQASPNLIRRLNPGVDWANVAPGLEVTVPAVAGPEVVAKAAFAVITLEAKTLQAFDSESNLVAHFPCSIAARVEKRPLGELRVVAIAENPNYTFNPEVFPESPEARELGRKLILPPGPNNPVGVAWVSLNRPGYGIHGTPSPEQVGRTESHGCFRLANWNAKHFLKLAWVGMPVYVEP
ncbi:MAG TPA: L,D-transpeptidase [Verrucomicrobiae bacterium]